MDEGTKRILNNEILRLLKDGTEDCNILERMLINKLVVHFVEVSEFIPMSSRHKVRTRAASILNQFAQTVEGLKKK